MPTKLAIIIPIYNEAELLGELVRQLVKVSGELSDYEVSVLLVDDGSSDSSLEQIEAAANEHPIISYISLSRNFGHQAAISAGVDAAEADAYVLMDGDLQDPPSLIPDLVAKWQEGYEVVLAERKSRKETRLRLFLMNLYHKYSGFLTDYSIPKNTGLFCLMNAEALDAVKSLKERNRYFPGLREWVGFRTGRVFYDREARFAGEPKQNYRRLIHLALDSIFCYSYLPLRCVTYLGTLVSASGFLIALYFVIKRLLGIEMAEMGFTTIIVLITVLGGFQLIALGILGEYLARTYDESKGRPLYIVRKRG